MSSSGLSSFTNPLSQIQGYIAQFQPLSENTSENVSSQIEPVNTTTPTAVSVSTPTTTQGAANTNCYLTPGLSVSQLAACLGQTPTGTGLPTLLFGGFSWGRTGAFVAGLICLLVGLYLLKPTQQIIVGAVGHVKKTASTIAT